MSKHFNDLRIAFMGTPEFAVASLSALLEAGANVVAVVTAPDKPAGRGMQLKKSAVKAFAESRELKILQPDKLRAPEFIHALTALQPDLNVVVAFRMLPEAVWNLPPMGSINLHASLLPQYRGAAPINWAVINGEKQTGVTTFKLSKEIDTGNILFSEPINISFDETAGELHDKMMNAGARLVVKTIKAMASGTVEDKPQSFTENLKPAPKIFTSTCQINWNNNSLEVYNLIRGLSPFPGAFTELNGKKLKILRATYHPENLNIAAGSFTTDHKTYLHFGCSTGYVSVIQLQLEGKKAMNVQDFLRGYRFN